jgi:hypothetical protein
MTNDIRVTNDPWKAVDPRLPWRRQTEMDIMTMKALAGLVFLTAASGASAHDALLTQALARSALPASDLHGSIRTTTVMRGGKEPETENETVDLDKSPDKALASYAELKDVIGDDARVTGESAGRTTYAFTTRRLPHGSSGDGHVNFDSDGHGDELFEGKAEVSMDARGHPFVSHIDLHLPNAKGNFLARVRKIDVSYAFAPIAANDAMVATAVSVDVDVRALLFMHRAVHAESVLMLADAGH